MPENQQPTFTREILSDLREAHVLIGNVERFLLDRFAAYTRYTEVYDTQDRRVQPIEDARTSTSSGYGRWRLPSRWIYTVTAPDATTMMVDHYLADDRGPGSVTSRVEVPLEFVFGETERDADYETYLRLKARFEPEERA